MRRTLMRSKSRTDWCCSSRRSPVVSVSFRAEGLLRGESVLLLASAGIIYEQRGCVRGFEGSRLTLPWCAGEVSFAQRRGECARPPVVICSWSSAYCPQTILSVHIFGNTREYLQSNPTMIYAPAGRRNFSSSWVVSRSSSH
jgi:hypothetical protein